MRRNTARVCHFGVAECRKSKTEKVKNKNFRRAGKILEKLEFRRNAVFIEMSGSAKAVDGFEEF